MKDGWMDPEIIRSRHVNVSDIINVADDSYVSKQSAWEFAATHLLRERKSKSSSAQKDRGLAGHGVQKQVQSNKRVSGATFPEQYAHVADDSYFSKQRAWEFATAHLLRERQSKSHHHPIKYEW